VSGSNIVLSGLRAPLPGERLLRVEPGIEPNVDASWLKRTHLYSGRAVSHLAFSAEQDEREGRLALSGQLFTAGVISGLELWTEGEGADTRVLVAPGFGVAATGEDVRLHRRMSTPLRSLPVVTADFESVETLEALVERRRAEGQTAQAYALLLIPIVEHVVGAQDPDASFTPCEVDPSGRAFEDDTSVDGVRLAAREIEPALLPTDGDVARWRNALAYRIFALEGTLGSDARPWELWQIPDPETERERLASGVALGLLGYPPAQAPSAEAPPPFVDVAALARRGGGAQAGGYLPLESGPPELWQARIEQWTEQLRSLGAAGFEVLRATGVATLLRFLPPVMLLPVSAIDVRGAGGEPDLPLPRGSFLPAYFDMEAAPIELEALDDVLLGASFQDPLDVELAEHVQVLVPVPQQQFDPDLLVVEDETPDDFNEVILLLLLRLNHRLGRRRQVRADDVLFARAVGGEDRVYATDDNRVEGELDESFPFDDDLPAGEPRPAAEPLFSASLVSDQRQHAEALLQVLGGSPRAEPRVSQILALLESIAREFGFAFRFSAETEVTLIDDIIEFRWGGRGVAGFVDALGRRLIQARERLDMMLEAVSGELYRVRSFIADEDAATRLAPSLALSSVSRRSLGRAVPVAVNRFRSFLQPPPEGQELPPPTNTNYDVRLLTAGIPTGGRLVPPAVLFGASVSARLDASPAVDAANSARLTRIGALRSLLFLHRELGLSLDGLRFPGFVHQDGDPNVAIDGTASIANIAQLVDAFSRDGVWRHDQPARGDEAAFFVAAGHTLEYTVAAIRLAEARLIAFEAVHQETREFLALLQGRWDAVEARLAQLQDELRELRHDITVARVLEQEEIARARATNERRRRVIENEVPFLVLRRPRTVDALLAPPTYATAPGLAEVVIPSRLPSDLTPPDQLEGMLNLLREAPLRWLVAGAGYLARVKRWVSLWHILQTALGRARTPTPPVYDPFVALGFEDRVGSRARAIFSAELEALQQRRARTAARVLDLHARATWARLQELALDGIVAINDLLSATHGHSEIVRDLSRELSDIERVAGYLFQQTQEVPPFVRLGWVEYLSEPNTLAIDLRDLSLLPDWLVVERALRVELQSLVDWLYSRIDATIPSALVLMHDIVRVALMLSGHPAIFRSLGATPAADEQAGVGGVLVVRVERDSVRVGLHAVLYESTDASAPVGRGIVDDVGDGVARIRVIATRGGGVVRPLRVELMEPGRVPPVELVDGRRVFAGVGTGFG